MREVGPIRARFTGDTPEAQERLVIARVELGITKNLMAAQGLQQLVRTVRLSDGTTITCSSMFGQDTIAIDVPEGTAEKESRAVVAVPLTGNLAYYYKVALPAPCVCRTLSIFTYDKGTPPAVGTVASFVVLPSGSTSSSPGSTFYTTGGSCDDGCATINVSVSNSSPPPEAPPPPSIYSLWSGSFTIVIVPPGGTSDVNISGAWTDYLPAAQAAHDAAVLQYVANMRSTNFGKTYVVALSDGTVLTSWHASYDDTGVEINAPATLIWSGDGYVALPDGSHKIFEVPADVCAPPLPDTYPGEAPVIVFTTSTGRVISGGTLAGPHTSTYTFQTVFSGPSGVFIRNGSLVYQSPGLSGGTEIVTVAAYSDVPLFTPSGPFVTNGNPSYLGTGTAVNGLFPISGTFTPVELTPEYGLAGPHAQASLDWAAARAVARARERARLQGCSINLINNLKAGAFDNVRPYIRTPHPRSLHTYMPTIIVVNITTTNDGSGDNIIATKVVTLLYTYVDDNGFTRTKTQTFTGTRQTQITRLANSLGVPNSASFTTVNYINWLDVDTTGATPSAARSQTYLRDLAAGLCEIWNGIVVTGAASAAAFKDSRGEDFNPPQVASSDNVTVTYPTFYKDYRNRFPRRYHNAAGDTRWLDSVFLDGETLDIFPLSTVHTDLGDLGLFPQAADIVSLAKLSFRATTRYRFAYHYQAGSWEFIEKASLADRGVPMSLPYQAGSNCVVLSTVAENEEWPDVVTAYRLQANVVKSDALFGPLITALALLASQR